MQDANDRKKGGEIAISVVEPKDVRPSLMVPEHSERARSDSAVSRSRRDSMSRVERTMSRISVFGTALAREFPEGKQGLLYDKPSVGRYSRIALTLMMVPFVVMADSLMYMIGLNPVIDTQQETAHPTLMLAAQRSAYRYVSTRLTVPELRLLLGLRPARKELAPYSSRASKLGLVRFNKAVKLARNQDYSARWLHEQPKRKLSDPVLVYYHGGGYGLKLSPPQIEYLLCLLPVLARTTNCSSIILDYTVTPYAKFPTQLVEAVQLANHLHDAGHTNIVLLGDSCGANLELAMLQHIAHPMDGVPKLTVPRDNFTIAMCSPWCALRSERGGPSFLENDGLDILDGPSLDRMCDMFATPDDLLMPICQPDIAKDDPEYWVGVLPAKTVSVWAANEVLRDSCRSWARAAGAKHCYEEPKAVHDCMLHQWRSLSTAYLLDRLIPWLNGEEGPAPDKMPNVESIDAYSS